MIVLWCFLASVLGNVVAYWLVFKQWKFPKIIYVPVNKDNEELVRIQYQLSKMKKREGG